MREVAVKSFMRDFKNTKVLLVCGIVALAFILRVFGVNWDQNQHLHPDERFLTMVTTSAKIPPSLGAYLDPKLSTLNPYNLDFGFYVYGTLPVTLNKLVVSGTTYDTYNGVAIAGRYISAIADVATLLLIVAIAYMCARRYKLNEYIPVLTGLLYAIAVMPIQNAHYYTVDALTTFFLTLSAAFACVFWYKSNYRHIVLAGAAFGCALASKLSSMYIAPLIGGIILAGFIHKLNISLSEAGYTSISFISVRRVLSEKSLRILVKATCIFAVMIVIAGLAAYVSLRLGDPRIFANSHWLDLTLNPIFKENIQQLRSFSQPGIGFPPGVQWLSKKPWIFPLTNIAFFGVGIAYFITFLWGLIYLLAKRKGLIVLIFIWMLCFFIYQGSQYVTSMRYFYPMYPYIALIGALGIVFFGSTIPKKYRKSAYIGLIGCILIWPISFMAIYTRPHSRVTASRWILKNIPANSNIATEHWDDWLPLNIPDMASVTYEGISYQVFAPDTPEKWLELESQMKETDYYIITSNRGYGSILPLQNEYPRMAPFYTSLFAGKTQFEKIAEFTSYPSLHFGNMEAVFNDQWAEEAFTVYDHPKVTIFRNKERVAKSRFD